MNISTIEDLAYLINQAKKEKLPQPIVFLGAGASKTGDIPLADEIIHDILNKYKNSPQIKSLNKDSKTYAKLMECLTPYERNKLLKGYVDNAKINVSHIYLAQLLIEGYVDYVLTVNFDNLMLRALALFNNFPATYDMAILKDLTTTSFKEKSVVYLHGQHHGLWLLNTDEEMARGKEIIPPILNSIKNQRPWIFIGYSGEDPIFDYITKLGRFDNGLYWVTYYENNPSELVCKNLLEKPNTNSYLIKGYDADSFMLKLNAELNLPQPEIIDKPFTSLKKTLNNIVDIDDKEHFIGVKERLEIVKDDVARAIKQFEEGSVTSNKKLKNEIDTNLLKKRIIDHIIKENIDQKEINYLEKTVSKLKNKEINKLMAELYTIWGDKIRTSAVSKNKKSLFEQSIEKYKKAISINPKDDVAYNNCGISYWYLAELSELPENEQFHKKSIEVYKKSTEINPKNYTAYCNWGISLEEISVINNDIELNYQCIEKYKIAFQINPKYDLALYKWGGSLSSLALIKKDKSLFKECFKKFKETVEINPKNAKAYYSWGKSLMDYFKLTKDKSLDSQIFEKLKKASELGDYKYNLACYYAINEDKINALETLDYSLKNKEIETSFVLEDEDWNKYLDDSEFITIIKKHT